MIWFLEFPLNTGMICILKVFIDNCLDLTDYAISNFTFFLLASEFFILKIDKKFLFQTYLDVQVLCLSE